MRTTIELPPDVLRAAKARAAEQGESLKQWFTRAVSAALGTAPRRAAQAGVPWPVFGKPGGKKVRLTNADIAAFEAVDDVETRRRGAQRSSK